MGFEIEVHNRDPHDAYISILDLMPTGEWAVLWPPKNQTPVSLPAGKAHKVDDLWEVAPPYGTDVIKLFASEEPIDFQWLLGSRRGSRGTPPNLLELLFADVLTEDSRGGKSRKGVRRDAGVTTESVTYRIVPGNGGD